MPLITIQYARAVAALMIVVFHLRPQLERMGYEGGWPYWLASGVDIFFVISGYIMWWTTRDDGKSPGEFMRRRLVRVVPLYWAITSFYVLVLLVAPGLMQTGELSLPHVVSSYLFLPYPHPVIDGVLYPLVTPGWTLNFEMFFYAVFACVLFAPRQYRMPLLGLVLGGLVTIGLLLRPEDRYLATYTSSLLGEFLLGVIVAELVSRRILLSRILLLPAIAVAIAALPLVEPLVDGGDRGLFWGPPAALFIYAIVSAEAHGYGFRSAVPLFLGNASYSIYLSHQLTMSASGQVWRKLFGELTPASFAGFCIAGTLACIAVGALCYKLVEVPATKLARKLFDPGAPSLAHASWAPETPRPR